MKLFLSVLLSISFAFSNSQENTNKLAEKKSDTIKDQNYNMIYKVVDVEATPKNGIDEFRKIIATSFNLPEVDQNTIGSVTARFVVWDDGSLRDITIIKEEPTGIGLGAEVIRVISSSEKWIPAQVNGQNVKQLRQLPFKFEIKATPKKKKTLHPVKNIELNSNNNSELDLKNGENSAEPKSVNESKDQTNDSLIFTTVEKVAIPPGGVEEFKKNITKSLQLLKVKEPIKASFSVRFVVLEDGSLTDFQILKETPVGLGLGAECIQLLKNSEKWNPAYHNGKAVKQYFILPINVKLKSNI